MKTNYYYDDEEEGLVFEATENIPKGAEVTTTYGEMLTNFDLFLIYGFSYQPNYADDVPIRLELVSDDPSH